MDRWQTRIMLSSVAAAMVAGSWLLALALAAAVPPLSGSIAPPPISTAYSVTPGGTRPGRSPASASTTMPASRSAPPFFPIATPPAALVNDPCTGWMAPGFPSALRHPRCPAMVSAPGWMGR